MLSDLESTVILKGQGSPPPLILLQDVLTSDASMKHKYARHAQTLYRHLVGKLSNSNKYASTLSVGLESHPAAGVMIPTCPDLPLDPGTGLPHPWTMFRHFNIADQRQNIVPRDIIRPLHLTSAEAIVQQVQAILDNRAQHPFTEQQSAFHIDVTDARAAVCIDSLTVFVSALGFRSTCKLLSRLFELPGVSSLLVVLHRDQMSERSMLALEDLAVINVYIHPEARGGIVKGAQCQIIRRGVSGKVHESWETWEVGERGRLQYLPKSVKVVEGKSLALKALGSNGLQRPTRDEAIFKMLPFRLALNEQEKNMRDETVLPHQRPLRREEEGKPLIYHEEDVDAESGEEDDDVDDDLDL